MMRNNIDFKVFSGQNELKFTTQPENLRGQVFNRICINGNPTSYTDTMGYTWTEDWFVLREIYCNAIDETNCVMVKDTELISATEGKTRIYVELTEKLQLVVDSWDSYFSDEREPLLKVKNCYTSYLGAADIDGRNVQSVSVYQKTIGVMYRKGIRCYGNTSYLYDYGFDYVDINEDRTAKSASAISYFFACAMGMFISEEYVSSVLRSATNEITSREYYSLQTTDPEKGFSDKWIAFSKNNLLVIKEISGRFAEEISKTKKEVFLIPHSFAKFMKRQLPEVLILGIGKTIGDTSMTDVEMTPKMDFLIKDVLKSLNEMKYEVPYNINVVQFDDEYVLGQADLGKKEIYLSSQLFSMGRREIAVTIIEEVEHIISQKGDQTRAFQNHLISSWLTSMENTRALFL